VDDEQAEAGLPDRSSDEDHDALLARLGGLLRAGDGPPELAVSLAQQSFGLRTVDAELAALVADSEIEAGAVAVRAAGSATEPRLLTFEGSDLALEISVEPAGGRGAAGGGAAQRRLLGQVVPPGPARIEVRQPAAPDPRWIDADDRGRFAVENLDPGPVSLTCHRTGQRPVATEWTLLG
jgi:hypothetical protein